MSYTAIAAVPYNVRQCFIKGLSVCGDRFVEVLGGSGGVWDKRRGVALHVSEASVLAEGLRVLVR